jgi:hypothetical protein
VRLIPAVSMSEKGANCPTIPCPPVGSHLVGLQMANGCGMSFPRPAGASSGRSTHSRTIFPSGHSPSPPSSPTAATRTCTHVCHRLYICVLFDKWCAVDAPTAALQADGPTAALQADGPTAALQADGPTAALQADGRVRVLGRHLCTPFQLTKTSHPHMPRPH